MGRRRFQFYKIQEPGLLEKEDSFASRERRWFGRGACVTSIKWY
jgi:hypothetical protein